MSRIAILLNAFHSLKEIYTQKLNRIVEETNKSKIAILLDCIYARIRHGCDIEQYTLGGFYRLKEFERKQSLTIHRKNKLVNKLNSQKSIQVLSNKVLFNKHFSQFIHRGWIYSEECDWESFKSFFSNLPKSVLLKPIDAMQGKGIEKRVVSNDTEITQLYNDVIDKKILIEEFIQQHPRMVFGNKSVNTIRVMTMVDRNGAGHVLKAILRAGVGDACVDNYCAGGVIYDVDLGTGIVDSRGRKEHDCDNTIIIHPMTDIVMLGYRLPNWEQVMSTAKQAAEFFPKCRLIGFDIAITDDNVDLIEGNESAHNGLYEYLGDKGYFKKISILI